MSGGVDPLGVAGGVASNAIWQGVTLAFSLWFGGAIKISSPRSAEILQEPMPHGRLGKGISYAVHGTLRRLPADHKIWILSEDLITGEIWPNGFFAVEYRTTDGTWYGRVNAQHTNVKIHAVVAPPTSDDLFSYFQHVGNLAGRWTPLRRIPLECVNRAVVHAQFPATPTK